MIWEKFLTLFLPYSNGWKKLLPIKEIPKPLLKNLSLTILMITNCLAMIRTTLLILEKIDTICLACATAKNTTMFTYWWNSTINFLWYWCSEKKILHVSQGFWSRQNYVRQTFTVHCPEYCLLLLFIVLFTLNCAYLRGVVP